MLNLSYGTDGTQDRDLDPLRLRGGGRLAQGDRRRRGRRATTAPATVDLAEPGPRPVPARRRRRGPRTGTLDVKDDTIPAFSNRGTSTRHVDVVAPGVHILGLRVPGRAVDQAYPSARVGTRFFRGSGTSQSTAVVSGAAALLLQKYPDLTPQQVKMILGYSARFMARGTTTTAGAGIVNVSAAMSAAGSGLVRSLASTTTAQFGTGTGKLELARGSAHVAMDGTTLKGEKDIFGARFTSKTWAPTSLAGTAWTADGSWNGNAWTGSGFDAAGDWAGRSWVAASWTGTAWSGRSWVGRSWVGNSWDGRSWVADSWQGRSWVAAGWSSASWS